MAATMLEISKSSQCLIPRSVLGLRTTSTPQGSSSSWVPKKEITASASRWAHMHSYHHERRRRRRHPAFIAVLGNALGQIGAGEDFQ